MCFLPYLGIRCALLGVDSLQGGLAEGNRVAVLSAGTSKFSKKKLIFYYLQGPLTKVMEFHRAILGTQASVSQTPPPPPLFSC